MKTKIFLLLLLLSTSFTLAEEIAQNCPTEGAYYLKYFDGDLVKFECIKEANSLSWWYSWVDYPDTAKEKYQNQNAATSEWVKDGLKRIDKEEIFYGENIFWASSENSSISLILTENAILKTEKSLIKNIAKPIEGDGYLLKYNFSSENITFTSFVVNENGSTLIINNESFYAFPGSTVEYTQENGIEISIESGFDISSLLKDANSRSLYSGAKISGENIKISDDFSVLDGQITITEDGYLLEEGSVNYKQAVYTSATNDNILFVYEDSDLSDYEGNWVKQTDDSLTIQTSSTGKIRTTILENNEILNSDEKDKTNIIIENGDGIEITSREDDGLVPKVEHLSSEDGSTYIENDGIRFTLDSDEISIEDIEADNLTDIKYSEKYQSIAMEITSDSKGDNSKLKINAYRQFAITTEKDKELVTYNAYNLPISSSIEDNSLQTLEQLREKYPDIEFVVDEEFCIEENLPPYLAYVLDNSFEENDNIGNTYDKIIFSEYESMSTSAYGATPVLTIGSYGVDTYMGLSREKESPLELINHEYNHYIDKQTQSDEIDYIRSLSDTSVPGLSKAIGDLEYAESIVYANGHKSADSLTEAEYTMISDATNNVLSTYQSISGTDSISTTYESVYDSAANEMFSEENKEKSISLIKELTINIEKSNLGNEEIDSLIESIDSEIDSEEIDSSSITKDLTKLYNSLSKTQSSDSSAQTYKEDITEIIESQSSFLYQYSSTNRDEMSSTWAELTPEQKKIKYKTAKDTDKTILKQLLQLEFDKGFIDAEEYMYVLGIAICRNDCIKHRCESYKLMCCVNYPNSPNC